MLSPLARPLFFVLALVPVAACSSADGGDPAGESGSSLVSGAKTFLVPTDERARLLCHDEINRHYCDATSAQRAAAACLAKIGARAASDPCKAAGGAPNPGCLRYETQPETCLSSAPVYPSASSCRTPRPRSCHFYSACLETRQPCGSEGYAIAYGERYCYAFKNARFSAKGEAWRDGVMLCLQEELVPKLSPGEPPGALACDELGDFAFASHPACYTQPGRSICFLPPSDLAAVFSTIGLDEALKGRTLGQMRRVVGTCVGQLARRIFFGQEASGIAPRSAALGIEAVGVADEAASPEELRASYAFWEAKADEYGVER